jgi:lysophospholipase L1-like esterase
MIKSVMDEITKKLRENKKYWIAFVGDSITSTEWVHPNWREIVEYVVKSETEKLYDHVDWKIPSWGIRCFNWGFDGATTKDILEKADQIVRAKPDLIVGLMGTNDPRLGIKSGETKNNIESLMNKFRGIRVFWMTSTPDLREEENKKYEDYRKITLGVKCNENQEIFDLFSEYKKFDLNKLFTLATEEYKGENYQVDPSHPNQLGNAYIAKIILKEIWNIEFDPEKYIETTKKGYKYPEY